MVALRDKTSEGFGYFVTVRISAQCTVYSL